MNTWISIANWNCSGLQECGFFHAWVDCSLVCLGVYVDPSYLLIIDQEWVASILTGVPSEKHFGDSSESSFLTLLLLETWVWHPLRGVSHQIEIITYKNVDFFLQACLKAVYQCWIDFFSKNYTTPPLIPRVRGSLSHTTTFLGLRRVETQVPPICPTSACSPNYSSRPHLHAR